MPKQMVAAVQAQLRAYVAERERLAVVAAEHFGLSRTELRVLELLREQPRPMTPTALADALGVTTGGVARVIDRLERAGLVTRQPDAFDRRRVVVHRTEAAKARDAAIFGAANQATEAMIALCDDGLLELIRDFMAALRWTTAHHADQLLRELHPIKQPRPIKAPAE